MWTLACFPGPGVQNTYSLQDAQGRTDSQARTLSLHRCRRTSGVGRVQKTEPWVEERMDLGEGLIESSGELPPRKRRSPWAHRRGLKEPQPPLVTSGICTAAYALGNCIVPSPGTPGLE